MATKTIVRATLLGVALTIILTSCPSPCIEAVYNFRVQVAITPALDSVKVGDTLFLKSSFPTTLFDYQTKIQVDYSNARAIGGTLGLSDLFKIDTLGSNSDSSTIKYFEYANIQGRIYNSKDVPIHWRVNQTEYVERNGQYQLLIGIIPQKRGIYGLGVSDALSNGREGVKNCEKANFEVAVTNPDKHLYLYEQALGRQINGFDSRQSFFFKVY